MSSTQPNQLPQLSDQESRYHQFKGVLNEAQGICKGLVTRVYNGMNKEITARDQHISAARADLATANASLSIVLKDPANEKVERLTKDMERMASRLAKQDVMLQRPDTAVTSTSSILETRAAIDIARAAEAYQIPLGTNYEKMLLITAGHAQQIINERSEVKQGDEELNCWTSRLDTDRDKTYAAVNLANTYSRVPGRTHEKIGIVKLYLHQLAIIGKGDLERLSWCTQANSIFQVSHLCHNPRCFNPQHLVVEEAALNKARNICQYHEVVMFGGLRYNPCPHGGRDGATHSCILPRRVITEPGNHHNQRRNF